ncbi:MAG TPA: signal peptidase I [Candidatus Saccharimonadales bacterium]|nr:signal peptidase I [Candidatus Saccharimonadales bacterium]
MRFGRLCAALFGGILLLCMIATWFIAPFQVQGTSMEPTLHNNQIVFVWEFPQTWAKLTGSQYVPRRGSVVIVKKSPILGEQLIKRVIGVPGDKVIINNSLTVYNQAQPNGFDPDIAPYGKNLQKPQGVFTTQVANGQVFVMGDNRDPGASIDSRSSLGNVPSDNLVGKVVLRIFPFTIF